MPEFEATDVLHWDFDGHSVLFSGISNIWLACVLVIVICLTERFLQFVHERHWAPSFCHRHRLRGAIWKTILYWNLTLLRLCEMLVVMTLHAGLLLLTVTTLAISQFFIELQKYPCEEGSGGYSRINDENVPAPYHHATPSKNRPNDLSIHPNHSNAARAEAAAMELGIFGQRNVKVEI
ncbi:hypothetical protein L218DRAFT_50768 [Marasmius fiardii PR-910]|nr:hypothetical protein L218DRAFT_50768 [Marasmius fiardii PR-910]